MHNDGMVLDMTAILVMSVGASDVCHGAACDSQCAALQQLEHSRYAAAGSTPQWSQDTMQSAR